MKSNHIPKNTTLYLPPGHKAERAELFWQTANCDHFMENYRADLAKSNPSEQVHNLKFADVARMLSGNVLITPVPKSVTKYQAISYWQETYYLTIFTLEHRVENPSTLFAVIITTYITHESRHLSAYQAYADKIRQLYNR
ncbi:hypothetical protein [Spirosoma flavum]|uniref:Uncharacterized protein n=1 Tax=Spirosoma flavum TaxID=2048557 RepID=A0ABW6AUT5_9BACT